jgi:cytochrome P450
VSWLSGCAFALGSSALEFYSDCERRAGVVKTHVWRLPVYVVTEPSLIEDVLVRKHRCFMKSAGLRATQRGFGRGLLTADGPLWRQQRRIMQPAFQAQRVDQYKSSMQRATARLLAGFIDGGERNIHCDMTDLCFEALASSLFGEDMMGERRLVAQAAEALHAFHDHYSEWIGSFGGLFFTAFRTVATWLGRPDFVIDPCILPTGYAKRFRDAVALLDQAVNKIIKRKRQEPLQPDLLGLLLAARDESGHPLSDRQIRDEVVTMFFAGHETGAAVLTWTFYLLARHPEITERLRHHIQDGSESGMIEQVLREAMRLYPPAYRISRTVVETCHLGATKVTAGAELVIPQWAVHRSPRYYDEPEQFRPERWSPDFISRLPHFAYFPFGGGPRTCIGNTFGMVESRFVVSRILQEFNFAPPQMTPGLHLGVTLLPEDNTLMLKLVRRRSANTN